MVMLGVRKIYEALNLFAVYFSQFYPGYNAYILYERWVCCTTS